MTELSIIVTIYNIEPYLPQCLNSILNQTYKDYELILVNDGSTDGCGAICNIYAKLDSRIKVIHQKNRGLVNARKAGLMAAQGKYIGYVDGDDWIEPDMYKMMMKYAKKYNCDIVMSDIDFNSDHIGRKSGALDNSSLKNGFYDRYMLESEIFPIMLYAGYFYKFGVYPVIWNKLFRRELLYKHQMAVDENIKFGEDIACVYPCMYEAESIYFMKNSHYYHYRYSDSQMTYIHDRTFFPRLESLYNFFKQTDFAKAEFSRQVVYYFKYALKQALDNEVKSSHPMHRQARYIKHILSSDWVMEFLHTPLPESTSAAYKLYYRLVESKHTFLLILVTKIYRFFNRH